jgi:hypothetical protein
MNRKYKPVPAMANDPASLSGGSLLVARVACTVALMLSSARMAQAAEPDPATVEHFERKVRPLLVSRCGECHGAVKQKAGLRLDSAAGLTRGGDSGAVVVPGDPEKSRLIQAVRYHGDLKMPPKGKLSAAEISDLVVWVKAGAIWPKARVGSNVAGQDAGKEKTFWAFQPIRDVQPPTVRDNSWPRSPLDRFILAGLESHGLRPAPPADRRTLLRRATFDLIGLPPTPEEVAAFLADDRPNAFARVIDRLLASPHYGERWGRRWLDVARYADSNGLDENYAYAHAFHYRDYVIAAFNRDKPYDLFLHEQLAGDLLPASPDPETTAERIIATGFLALGPKPLREVDATKMELDIIDEQVATVGKALLALTLECARCHDHKFDPIPTADYYSLAGIFKSTKTMARRTDKRGVGNGMWLERDVATNPPGKAMAVAEGTVQNLRVHLRGSQFSLGPEVPRRFPRVLAGDRQAPLDNRQSGRLALARWLTRPDHPLTSRVMVNRIWQGHFGAALVRTPDNFGKTGDRPADPRLLDWLARRFVESGWSIKAMHRLIMLSATYQMSTAHEEQAARRDPENRLHWRMNRRRLEAEAVRDALLAVGCTLDVRMGGTLMDVPNGKEVVDPKTAQPLVKYDSRQRSVYLPVARNVVYDLFQTFDFPDPTVVNGERATTTVAPQALLLLNSPLVIEQAKQMARRLLERQELDEAGRIRLAYERAYGRLPLPDETATALDFLTRYERALQRLHPEAGVRRLKAWQSFCQALVTSNEFLYIE